MLLQIYMLLVGTLADLLAMAFLARFAMQWARAPFRNPVGRFVMAATDWAVVPLRRIVPGLFNLDLASLLVAWAVQSLHIVGLLALAGAMTASPAGSLGIAALAGLAETLRLIVYLAMGVIIVSALLSWINPYAPLAPLFNQLAQPMLRPVQRRLPTLGGVDLSPLVVLLALQVLLMALGAGRAALLPMFFR
jgi:YggT family protein